MPWKILPHNCVRRLGYLLILAIFICASGACVKDQTPIEPVTVTAPPVQPKPSNNVTLQQDEINLDIELIQKTSLRSVRKVRSQSMLTGGRHSFEAGTDILRILQYDEELITLPKMQPSKDFIIECGSSEEGQGVKIHGYSNVTYELLNSSRKESTLLLNSYFATLNQNGTLNPVFLQPTGTQGVFKKVPVKITPANVKFTTVTRTVVLPKSEHHYVIRFIGKKGMNILFEIRNLTGGSRPKVKSRTRIAVPLGMPLIEISGHRFKVHTATTDFLDIERIK